MSITESNFMRLIPAKDRNSYRCCMCMSKPVKYFMLTRNLLETESYDFDDLFRDLPYCNRCAALFFEKNLVHFEDMLNEAGYDVNWTPIKDNEMDLHYSLSKRSE